MARKKEKITAEEVIEKYKKGQREFKNFDLDGANFSGQNLP